MARRAYLSGLEGIPWQSQVIWSGDELCLERDVDDSGYFYLPWLIDGYGELLFGTTSLMERESPYYLPLELARGVLCRLRNQLAIWQPLGFEIPGALQELIGQSTQKLSLAATGSQGDTVVNDAAEQSIAMSVRATEMLIARYTNLLLQMRQQTMPKLSTILAANLESSGLGENVAKSFVAAFNSAVVPLRWSDVEFNTGQYQWQVSDRQLQWCHQHGLKVIAGPLLQMDARSLPDWLFLWDGDFDNLSSYALNYAEAAVLRYRGQVAVWNCTARMNMESACSLTEEQRLKLTLRVVEMVKRHEPKTPVIVTMDQPWGEHVAHDEVGLTPLHFADALVRADIGLAGIGLEVNLGYVPRGTEPRDLLDFTQQLDFWSCLGLPLLVFLTVPSNTAPDPLGDHTLQVKQGAAGGILNAQTQCEVVRNLVRLFISKQAVQGVIWNQLDDSKPHDFLHGGLVDGNGRVKPVMDMLAEIRERNLI